MATDSEIEAVFFMLAANYDYIQKPNFGESPQGHAKGIALKMDIFKQTLSDIDGDLLRASALKIISTSKWFPSVAELREAALDIAEPNGRRTGLEAWGDVVAAFHRDGGQYGNPQFDDPIASEVVRMLGWQTLCLSEDQTADRARFIDGYNAIASCRRNETLTLPEVRRVQAQIQGRAQDEIKRLAEAKRL